MKKVLAFLLLLMYFTVSTGFIISRHFCMDRFASAQLGSSSDDKCHKCGMHKDGGCCRDEVKIVKLATSHVAGHATAPDFSLFAVLHDKPGQLAPSFINHTQPERPASHGPPLSDTEIYIRNCVFRL